MEKYHIDGSKMGCCKTLMDFLKADFTGIGENVIFPQVWFNKLANKCLPWTRQIAQPPCLLGCWIRIEVAAELLKQSVCDTTSVTSFRAVWLGKTPYLLSDKGQHLNGWKFL